MPRPPVEDLEDLYENAPCGYLSLQPDGQIAKANATLSRWTGYAPQDLLEKRFQDLLHVGSRVFYDTHFAPLLRMQGFFNEVALDIVVKDGTRIPVLANAMERRNDDGDLVFIRVTIFQAADRRRYERELIDAHAATQAAQRELQINEERFRLTAKATGNALWEWDIPASRIWWSDGLRDIFGHETTDREIVSPSTVWGRHVHPDDKARCNDALDRLQSGKIPVFHERYRFQRADGTWADVEDRAFCIRNEQDKAVRILGSLTDISERQRLESQLRQAQKMETVGQLTGGVAHDFNNLLTIVLGNAEILSDKLNDQPRLQALAEMIANAADRGAELTHRLLAFARRQPLSPRVLDVSKLIQEMEGLLQRTLPENINLEIVRAGGLWQTEVDAGQLEAALLNIVLNARDAMPGGGSLTIETANAALDDGYVAQEMDVKAGQYVLIVITDTGHGIPAHVIGQVFEPFFSTKEVGQGSGLGLSMVYGFIKQSGGHIRVYSEPGDGTSFKLYLPRSHAMGAQVQIERAGRTIIGGRETILVVEDDGSVRAQVVAQLENLGYRIFAASAGAEALDILNQHQGIDVLFTDVIMPGGMNGRQLADAARARYPDLKVLFTSGYTENSIVHNGKLDRGVALLSKPYRREQLALKIRKVLDQG